MDEVSEMRQEFQWMSVNLKLLRVKNGMALDKLADQAGVSPAVLKKLENGNVHGDIFLQDIFAICDCFGIGIQKLFRRLGEDEGFMTAENRDAYFSGTNREKQEKWWQ